MKIGYARVSTGDQSLDLQRDALRAAGCDTVFEDVISGASRERPGLDAALAALRMGDMLVTWRLDRLGRSLSHLIALVGDLDRRGCGLVSLSEAIDTASASGKLLFHIMGALAEFERALISERTKAGLAARRSRGQHLGRRPKLSPNDIADARHTLACSDCPKAQLALRLGVSRVTLWRALR